MKIFNHGSKKLIGGGGVINLIFCLIYTLQGNSQTNYSPLYTSANFVKTIDLSRPVGTINASPGTTPGGGVIYNIPVYAPPGTNGIKPSISISYNSQANSGIAGFGWSISGLSVITRTGKNLYHNDEVTPVEYTWNDAFLLDGTRLNPILGNNAENGTVYATETESFSKTISWTGNGTLANPDWFEVTSKEGTIMQFGNTTDSRIIGEDGYSVMMWRLNRIIDINGNYIDFKYTFTGRDSRIDEINYTGNINTGLLPYNKIKFNYGGRYDQNTGYEAGASLSTGYLLNSIIISYTSDDGELVEVVKKYEFNYGYDNVHSLLKEVIEYGAGIINPPMLNSTIFLYGDPPANISVEQSSSLAGSNSFYSGDFDADGKADLLEVESYFDSQMNMRFDSKMTLIKDFGGSGATAMYIKDLPQGTKLSLDDKKLYDFLTSDYNKDGRDDVLQANIIWSTTHLKRYLTGIDINLTGSHNPSTDYYDYTVQNCPAPSGGYNYIHTSGNFFMPGDFDGDGNQDYILLLAKWITGTQFEYKAYVNFPVLGLFNQEIKDFGLGIQAFPSNYAERVAEADIITPIDLDGDGKMEIMVTHGATSYFYSIKKTTAYPGYSYIAAVNFNSTTEVSGSSKIYPGDFNGDRKTDMLVRNADATWKILTSTGVSFLSYSFTFNQAVVMDGNINHKIYVSDYNGDGRSDILHGISDGFAPTSDLSVYFSKGYASWFNEMYTYNNPIPSVQYVVTANAFSPGDFNGDGRTDMINIVSSPSGGDIIYFRPNSKERLLTKVTDGHNVTTSFEYKSLTDKTSFPYVYNRTVSLDGPPNQSPFNYVQLPVQVVATLSVPDGVGGTNTTNFYYEDAVIHRYAKGFLGFKKVTAVNAGTDVTSVTESEINTSFAVPYATKQTTKITSTNELLSESFITSSFVNLSTGANDIRFFQKVDKTLEVNHLSGTASENVNTYDAYGNVTTNISKRGVLSGNTVDPTETTTTTTVYGIHNTPVPAKPDNITVSNLRSGMPAQSISTSYTYTANGLPASETNFYGLPKAVTTNYIFNGFGNTIQTITAASGMSNRVANATYDARGRFPVSKQVVGSTVTQTETIAYDGKWGQPVSQTSSDCLTTTFEYDAFGRLKTTNLPEGYAVNNSLIWDVQGEQVFYSFIDFPGGKPDSKTWVDRLGREIKTQAAGFNNQWLTKVNTYDSKGNLSSQTNSYYPGETPIVTTTTYDTYNRAVTVSNPLTTITNTYTKLTGGNFQVTTQNSAGQSHSKISDATGKVISAIDNGGQLDYMYDSRGNQVEVKHGTTVMVSSVYDAYGRQTSLTDKNAGTITYEYDAFGQLIAQTDNNGNTYSMSYDDLGRIVSRQGAEGITTYDYFKLSKFGTCSNNNISTVTGFNGVIKKYGYDNLRRLQTERVTIDGLDYVTTYTYDVYGNLSSTTYPSGIVVNNIYDGNGGLISVTGGDYWNPVTLFTANAINGFGQYTNYTLGNGKTSQNTYEYGIPTRFYTPGVQDLNFTFDYSKGNLLSRYDALKNITETFQYDNLNRLTNCTVNGVQQLAINYDGTPSFSMGNISSKTDAGDYVYKNDKIHAVAYITNPAGPTAPPVSISPNLQNISYTPFLKTASVSEGSVQTNFTYGPDYQRVKSQLYVSGNLSTTKIYPGTIERVTDGSYTRDIHYISAGNGLCAIIEKPLGGNAVIHFIYTDYLGSLLTRTDINGTITAEQNFDAWGRGRGTSDWQYASYGNNSVLFFDRGYTGHEQMPYHALINMNGRMYDPIQGRMLSPDNYVPNPFSTQGYNRYSYANNNPLVYTDPDGNIIWFVVGAAALINGFFTGISHDLHGKSFLSGFFKGAISGAITGAGATSFLNGMLTLAGTAISSQMPAFSFNIGDHLTVSLSPSIVLGSGAGFGLNASANIHGDFGSIGFSYGFTAYARHYATGKSFLERRFGYGVTLGGRNFHVGIGTSNFKGGGLDQTTGYATIGGRNWSVTYENDGTPFSPDKEIGNGDGGDSYRTMSAIIRVGEYSLGTQLFTGKRDYKNVIDKGTPGYPFGRVGNPEINDYKFAGLFVGYGNYRAGWNHYKTGHLFQNVIAHTLLSPQARIPWLNHTNYYPNSYYGGYFRSNPFTNW